MEKWELRKLIIAASIPSLMQMVMKNGIGIASKVMTGQMGEAVIAAAGVAEQLIFFILMLFSAVGAGITTLASQSIGAGKHENMKKIFGTSMSIGIGASLFFTVLFFIFSRAILKLMGASDEVAVEGVKYISIASFSIPAIVMSFIMGAFIRAYADNKTPLYAAGTAMIIDVILGYLFIIVNKMGIEGAAFAALISRNIEFLIILILFKLNKKTYQVSIRNWKSFSKNMLKRISEIGWPVSIDMFIWQFGAMVSSFIVLSMGTISSGVNEVVRVVPMLTAGIILGVSMGAVPLIGQNLGKDKFREAENTAAESIKIGIFMMTVLILIVLFFIPVIVNFFNLSYEGRAAAKNCLYLITVFQYGVLLNMFCANIIRTGGDTKVIIAISAIGIWGVGIPLAYFLGIVLKMGIYGAVIGTNIGECIKGYLFYRRYKAGKWKKRLI